MRNITEMYEGFHSKMEKLSKDFLKEYKQAAFAEGLISSQDIQAMENAEAKLKKWKMDDFGKHFVDGEEILKKFVAAIDKNIEFDSLEVQALVNEHYKWCAIMSGAISKQAYYNTYKYSSTGNAGNNKMVDYCNARHPKLMEYLLAAMKIFAE